VGTAIVPPGNPTPILDPAKHHLDFVALFVKGCAVAAPCRSVLARRTTRCDTLLLQGGDEPIRIIAAVGDHVFSVGETGQQASRAGIIAGVPCCQPPMHRLACLVADRVQLRSQATCRAANTAGYCPFVSRLAAVL